MTTIADLEGLGYTVGLAHGSIALEEAALRLAQERAGIQAVQHDVDRVTTAVAVAAQARGLVGQDLIDIVAKSAAQALQDVTEARNEQVAFHERALQHAQETPDVLVINGPGVHNLYVKCGQDGSGWDADAQAVLDALADKKAHKERVTQHEASLPDA